MDVAEDTGVFTFYYTSYAVYFVIGNLDCCVSILFVLLSFSFLDQCYNSWCDWTHLKCVLLWSKVHLDDEVSARLSVIHSSPRMKSNNSEAAHSPRSFDPERSIQPSTTGIISPSMSPQSSADNIHGKSTSSGLELEMPQTDTMRSTASPQFLDVDSLGSKNQYQGGQSDTDLGGQSDTEFRE